MKLFHTPGTRSLAPIIVAEWLDIKLDLRKVDLQNLDSYFLSLSPLGQVPVLEMNSGECKTQVDAILQYFCALNPEGKLVGKDIFDWFEIDRWIAFLTGDFSPAFAVWFKPGRYTTKDDEESVNAVKAAAENRIHRVARVLEEQVGTTKHIVLGRRTLVDAYGFAVVRWLELLDGGYDQYPNLKQFMDRMNDDYHVQKALIRETSG